MFTSATSRSCLSAKFALKKSTLTTFLPFHSYTKALRPSNISMARTRRASQLIVSEHDSELEDSSSLRPAKRLKRDEAATAPESIPGKSKPRRKTKSKEVPLPKDLPIRVLSLWKVGAHISSAGGVENSVVNAAAIGANAFALFLKSQRKWTSPAISAASVSAFKERLKEFNYEARNVLPHGSYLINLGNPDQDKREKSYECFVDDLKRCEQLGLELYNFHPGSTVGATTTATSISLIAACINRAHKETNSVTIVLENMAGAGNIIGSNFEHLASIISEVEDKSRVGVCLDTCHMFAAGYDIRTKDGWNETLAKFDAQVGLQYLRGMHLNDSKTPYNSNRDRHENIGLGHLGFSAFHHILTDPRTQNIPLVLETPSFEQPDVWAKEVEVLYQLSGTEAIGEEGEGLVSGIKEVVKEAEGASGKGGKKKVRRATRKGKDTEPDDGDEEEHDPC